MSSLACYIGQITVSRKPKCCRNDRGTLTRTLITQIKTPFHLIYRRRTESPTWLKTITADLKGPRHLCLKMRRFSLKLRIHFNHRLRMSLSRNKKRKKGIKGRFKRSNRHQWRCSRISSFKLNMATNSLCPCMCKNAWPKRTTQILHQKIGRSSMLSKLSWIPSTLTM